MFDWCRDAPAVETIWIKAQSCEQLELDFIQWFVETFTYA